MLQQHPDTVARQVLPALLFCQEQKSSSQNPELHWSVLPLRMVCKGELLQHRLFLRLPSDNRLSLRSYHRQNPLQRSRALHLLLHSSWTVYSLFQSSHLLYPYNSERLQEVHRNMDYMLLLPGRKYQGSEQNLSDMDGLDSVRVHGIRQLHLYLLNLPDLRNPMSQSSESHEMFWIRQRNW